MNLTLRKPKTWPYAASSTGRPRGALPLGSRSIFVFEAIGKAREEYNNKVHKSILEHLKIHAHELQTSGCVVLWSLYMMGRSAEKTKPMVMFMSDDKKARTEAFDLVKKSGIMKEFPGFEIGHMALKDESEHLMVLGAASLDNADSLSISTADALAGNELPDVFASKGPIVGARLQVRLGKGDNNKLGQAVAGGIVRYKGTYYIHTVSHFLFPADNADIDAKDDAPSTEESSDISETQVSWDATGLSDFEDDSDEDSNDLVEITSRGSATPESSPSDSCSSDSIAPPRPDLEVTELFLDYLRDELASSFKELTFPAPAIEPKTEQPPKRDGMGQDMVKVGRVAWFDKVLDSAFIKLDIADREITKAELPKVALPLENLVDQIGPATADSPVQVSTTSGGSIHGTLSGTHLSIRLPHSTTFQTVYAAKLTRPLSSGDCGTWVKHAVSGKLLGYVVAGSPSTGLILLLAARNIVESFLGLRADGCDPNLPKADTTTEETSNKDRLRFQGEGRVVPRVKTTSLEVDEPVDQITNRSLQERKADLDQIGAVNTFGFNVLVLTSVVLSLLPSLRVVVPAERGGSYIIPIINATWTIPFLHILFHAIHIRQLLNATRTFTGTTLHCTDSFAPYAEKQPERQSELPARDRHLSSHFPVGLAQLLFSHGTASGFLTQACKILSNLLVSGIQAFRVASLHFIFTAYFSIITALFITEMWLSSKLSRLLEHRLPSARHKVSAAGSGGNKNYLEYIFSRQRGWNILLTFLSGTAYLMFGNIAGNAVQFGLYLNASLSAGKQDESSKSMAIFYAVTALTVSAMLRFFVAKQGIGLTSILQRIMGAFKVVILCGFVLAGLSIDAIDATRMSLVESLAAFVMALVFMPNVHTETNTMIPVGTEMAMEGILPFGLRFAHGIGPVTGKLNTYPHSGGELNPIPFIILSWALNILLVITVGRFSMNEKPGYSFRVQFLSFLTEAVIHVIIIKTLNFNPPERVVLKDGENDMDLLFNITTARFHPRRLRGCHKRLLDYCKGMSTSLKDWLSRLTGVDRWRLARVRLPYIEVDDEGEFVQRKELIEWETGLNHFDFQRVCGVEGENTSEETG